MPTKEVNCEIHRNVDVAVSGDSGFLLVSVHNKRDDKITHYSFSDRFGFEVETIHV